MKVNSETGPWLAGVLDRHPPRKGVQQRWLQAGTSLVSAPGGKQELGLEGSQRTFSCSCCFFLFFCFFVFLFFFASPPRVASEMSPLPLVI